VVAAVYELEQSGLVHADGAEYGFAHERIREIARATIEADVRRSLHWDIGELLLARYGDEAFGERVFEVVDQLDAGLPLAGLSEPQRVLLVRLNLAAGQRALDAAAWASAQRYFDLAVELLGDESTRAATQPQAEAFAAWFGQAQAMALQGHNEAADQAFAALLRWPLSPEQRGRVLARRIKILDALERPSEAVDCALAALAEFDLHLPRKPSGLQVMTAIVFMLQAVKGVTRERMLTMPAVTDEREAAILHILAAANGAAWLSSQELWLVLMTTHARRVMKAGYHPTAPQSVSMVATVFMTMGKAAEALAMNEIAIELAEQRVCTPAAAVGARSNLLTMVGPQCRPFREVAKPMEQAHRAAIEAGERYVAGFIGSLGLVTHLEAGAHLRDILDIDARLRAVDASFGGPEIAVIAEMMRRFIHVLLGTEGATVLRIDDVETKLSPLMRYVIISVQVWERALFGDADRGWALLEPLLHDYERVLLGSLVVPRVTMLAAILAFWRFRASAGPERRRLRKLLRKLGKTSRRWAKIGPSNYQPMADIVAGVQAAIGGRGPEAQRAFEAAHTAALASSAHYVAGLASMCLADWAAHEGLATTERGARRSAREAFERMGARAVVAALDQRHGPMAVAEVAPHERSTRTNARSMSLRSSLTADRTGTALDLASVLGTLQAFAENLELEQVISRVLGSAIENAGADRGALLLERGGELSLVAEGNDTQTTHFVTTPVPLRDARDRLPTSALLYVLRTGGSLVVDDMSTDSRFSSDSYVGSSGVRALLCMPILKQSERIGALVLENHLTAGAFTPARLEVLRILLGQAASALDNARLYAALARSEAQWRSLVDGVPDIIAVMDADGQLEFVNHLSAYGSDPSALIGMFADQHMDPSSAERWREAFAAVRASHEPRELEVCITPEGLPRRWYNTRIAAIEAGAQTKYLSISTDITERKQLESQVRQQQRLESIGTLASGVAHEINNPVQGILNYAELMHARADDPTTVREFCDEISRESERVATIVRNLLAFSRQEREQAREPVDVRKLVDATLSLIHAVIRKDNVRVEVEIPADLPRVPCRPQQIQQVIMNLVTNARDALNSRYAGYHDDKRIEISAETFTNESRPWMRITVADHGGGIPADVRERVFDPFFTTKGRDKGTGLGLSVSHGIALDHGGKLRLESELGVGTRFFLELPLDA
jgi:PAS domain S-box-containing protein